MTKTVDTLDEAREIGSELKRLTINKSWKTPWQEVIGEFSNLKYLHLCSGVDTDLSKVKLLPQGIVAIDFVLKNPKEQLIPYIKALPALQEVSLCGSHLKSGELPIEIGELKQLKKLELVSCGLKDVPKELANCQDLQELTIRGLPMQSFPEVICELANLKTLEFRQKIKKLPDTFTKLQNLKKLDFSMSFNSGTMSVYKNESKTNPLPTVIGQLKNLKDLNLDMCGIFERDIHMLKGLTNLEKLSIKYASVSDLSCMHVFPKFKVIKT